MNTFHFDAFSLEFVNNSEQKLVGRKAGFVCPQNDGGYFIWAKLPEPWNDSLRFGLALYDEVRTAVIPGVHFGKEWNNYIRINIAREEDEFIRGINNLIEFTKRAKAQH